MQKNNDPDSRQQQHADMNAAAGRAQDTIRREAQSAREALHEAQDEVTRKAAEYATEAKATAVEQAEVAQKDVSASLAAFGGALRAAGDHLAGSDQRAASQFMLQAANGIDRFAGSLKNKPFADVIDDVRTFGRENSGALIAGSLLAGLALGRFVKSSMPESAESKQPQRRTADEAQQASSDYGGTETRSSG
jgi:hypothetical protein